ncbi:MAG: transcriptional regulator GcvA [Azospirillum sp.]|nr:transcriptional regulator GcvA [Azospirillum sp.]
MVRRLPPLNAIRAFEAAARHLSFTRAAGELNVTQAAISHQIKGLEERLGTPLFHRQSRGLVLTEAGQHLLPPVREAFDQIAIAADQLMRHDRHGVLTVSTMPSLAAKWLVLRLARFQAIHPELDVRLSTSAELVDFTRQDVDIAIRFGKGDWPGLRADLLMSEQIFPVASPRLISRGPPLVEPGDLRRHVLLHDDYVITWSMWLRAAGITGVDAGRGARFNDSALLLQAAAEGQGVALARDVLAGNDLASGRLVRLFEVAMPGAYSYYVAAPPAHFARPKIAAFRDWLIEEARRG